MVLLNTVMKLTFSQNVWNFLTSCLDVNFLMRIMFCIDIYFCKPISYLRFHDHLLGSDFCRENYHSIRADCTLKIEINVHGSNVSYRIVELRCVEFVKLRFSDVTKTIFSYPWSCDVQSSWNVMAHGDARVKKWRGNKRMGWVAGKRHMTAETGLHEQYKPCRLMCTARLPVVDWTDAPADLNGLVRLAERRNLVLRVCHHISNAGYYLGVLFCKAGNDTVGVLARLITEMKHILFLYYC
jgi:hypothetical protein